MDRFTLKMKLSRYKMDKALDHGCIKVALNSATGKLHHQFIDLDLQNLILTFTKDFVPIFLEKELGQKLIEKILKLEDGT